MRPVQTVVVEPGGLLREGLEMILAENGFQPVRVYPNLGEFFDSQVDHGRYLFIIGTLDARTRLAYVARLRRRTSTARIVALLEDTCPGEALTDLLQAGTNAVLSRSAGCAVLLKTLELILLDDSLRVYTGDFHEVSSQADSGHISASANSPSASRGLSRSDLPASFSHRELAVLACLQDGASNKGIGRKLGITESTVKVHLKAIMRKLGADNRTQTAIWAMRRSAGRYWPAAVDSEPDIGSGLPLRHERRAQAAAATAQSLQDDT